jgi:hypothetical protein
MKSYIENILYGNQLININSKIMIKARTNGVKMGRGTFNKVDFYTKKEKISIEHDIPIFIEPTLKYNFITTKINIKLEENPFIKCYIYKDEKLLKGWINISNIITDKYSKL